MEGLERSRERTQMYTDVQRPRMANFEVNRCRNMEPDDVCASPPLSSSSNNRNRAVIDDGISKSTDFRAPEWLNRYLPIVWSEADTCSKTAAKPGRNCCLFAPLNLCAAESDIVNGFCTFHLRAIFNMTLQSEPLYQLSAKGNPTIWFRTKCFVADPRPIDDRITACFPIFELFPREPNINDILLFNLQRYYVSVSMPNWERDYSRHVNYLHNLMTVYTNYVQHKRLMRKDQLAYNQYLVHWNLWNEHFSWELKKNPAQLYVFYLEKPNDSMQAIPLDKCSTITQMIFRLFSEQYTNVNDNRFLTGPANYGVWIRGHIAYSDNLCSYGTIMTKNVSTIGAMATLPLLRNDTCTKSLIYHTIGVNCDQSFCINAKMDLDNNSLTRNVMVTGGNCGGGSGGNDSSPNNPSPPTKQ